jgi:putative MATE family efflux protein
MTSQVSQPLSSPGAAVDERTRLLLEAPLLPTMVRLAAPNAVVMVTQISLGLIELYFVAQLGVEALASVSQVFPLVALVGAISQGAVGGGVLTAVARRLGNAERPAANHLVWYAMAIAAFLGLITTLIALSAGPTFYAAMGARGLSLEAAVKYSNVTFGFAVLIWLFNLLLAVVRGTGNLLLPLLVVCGGALVFIPLMPVLIFGLGPAPALGIIGGAVAVLVYYATGILCLLFYLFGHHGVLHPPSRPPRLRWQPFSEIIRVGGMAALVSATTNITLAAMTGFVGVYGTNAIAGYGAGARLEFLLTAVSYGIGGPAAIVIGTNIGAGKRDRALKASWIAVIVAGFACETVGVCAAVWPTAWLEIFSTDPEVVAVGTSYLRTVGPFFGLFGVGYALYCAGQGTGRMEWPVAGAVVRTAIAILVGALAARFGDGLHWIFVAASAGMAAFALFSLPGLLKRVGYGSSAA